MAINWGNTKNSIQTKSSSDTILVSGYDSEFFTAIENFFNTTAGVKDFNYVVNGLPSGIRSVQYQNSLSGNVTNAIGGRSPHNYGMAIDIRVDFSSITNTTLRTQQQAETYSVIEGASKNPNLRVNYPMSLVINALKNHPTLLSGATFYVSEGTVDYAHIELRAWRQKARTLRPEYWTSAGRAMATSPSGDTQPIPNRNAVSPYIATLESLHPFIQYELTRRRKSTETANVYMPFVKLTSLTKILKSNLSEGGLSLQDEVSDDVYCPSLGVHGEPEISYEDIYSPNDNKSIVGYATKITNGVPERVRVVVEDASKDPPNIPMPGIISVQTERNTAGPAGVRGGLFRATINIKAYSTGQVDALLRYFLRPATRVILELGRKSSNVAEEFPSDKYFRKFNWKRPIDEISKEIEGLVTLKDSQQKFIQDYIYGNFGNYEIFIGYVVKFDLKFTKDNTYDIVLTVHSVQQYEIPVISTGVNSINPSNSVQNPCDSVDIIDYFNPPSSWRRNTFNKLMTTGKGLTHSQHIIPLTGPGTTATTGGAQSPGYLITWEFFVNILLNDTEEGILSVFQLKNEDEKTKQFLRSSVIKPINVTERVGKENLNANEVSWSPSLRSVDPNVMVIYNPIAQRNSVQTNAESIVEVLQALGDIQQEERGVLEESFRISTVKQRVTDSASPVGTFSPNENGTSSLTKGVWINTNAIIDAFSGADTLSTALNRLLTSMNNATRGFWNLQLLSNDVENPGIHVIDMGLSKKQNTNRNPILQRPTALSMDLLAPNLSNNDDVERIIVSDLNLGTKTESPTGSKWTPNYLYLFNRRLQRADIGDTPADIGGELLNVSLESNLPQVIAVQAIAGVGGQTQRGTLNSIDIEQLRQISLYDVFPKQADNKCPDNSPCSQASTPTPPKPTEVPDDFVNAIVGTLEGNISVYRGEQFTAASIEPTKQTLIDEWKKTLESSVCKTPADDDPEKLTKIRDCELAIAQRTTIFDSYIADLRSARRETYETYRPGYLELVRQYSGMYGMAIDLIEYDISKLSKQLDRESVTPEKVGQPHPFNSSNLTKTIVDLTMPGIGGIQLFQSFGVDRVPSILERGYYVVTKVAHDFSTDTGWVTKIQGRFRYNPPDETTKKPEQPCSGDRRGDSPPRQISDSPPQQVRTLSAQEQISIGATTTKPITEFTNSELVARTEAILQLTNRTSGRFGTMASRAVYEQRVADGTIARLEKELEIIDAEAIKRIRAGQSGQRVAREFQGRYIVKLQDRFRKRGGINFWNN